MASAEKNPSSGEEQDAPKTYEPEPEDEGMIPKPGCQCVNCDYWSNSADWCPNTHVKFESKEKPTKEKNFKAVLRSKTHPGKAPKIRSYNPNCLSKIERQMTFRTVVHGEIIPDPVDSCVETYFSEKIHTALQNLNYKRSIPIQSFAWPAIFRQDNVFMIGDRNSGKTLGYLPAICTFSTPSEERYAELAKYKGPLVIIICYSSKQCEEVYSLIKNLCKDMTHKPKVSSITYPITNIHSTDILITIPESLMHCLKVRMFNVKRLCHLVLEDTSNLLKTHHDNIYKILEVIDEMLEHRISNAKVQLIVTSRKWTNDLKTLLKSAYNTPLVCINDYLEAALYGNTTFEVKFLMQKQKLIHLQGILKDKYRFYKTVVMCDQQEIVDVNKWLVRNGIDTICLSENSSKEDVEDFEYEWSFMAGGQNKVLLCTDFVLDSLLRVNDAMWLINYSFPVTWTRFIHRFSALSTHYKSPLDPNRVEAQCKTFILIDETCEKQMTKILHFLGRLSKNLPPGYKKYAESYKVNIEHEKIDNRIPLCDSLKLLGKCSESLCVKRHQVLADIDVSDSLPKNGNIVFQILHMRDVTHFAVCLLEHKGLDGCVTTLNTDDLKKPLKYEKNEKQLEPQDVIVGKFYAHCDYTTHGKEYTLCHVENVQDDKVDVKLISGLPLRTHKSKLFTLPSRLKIVDIYLCNLIPPFSDEQFSGRSFHVARTSLQNLKYKSMILTGTIFLQLDNTLWLDSVVQMFNVNGTDVIKFNLTKHLVDLQVAEKKETVSCLQKLCVDCGIELPTYMKKKTKRVAEVTDVEPQRAYLDYNVNEVIFSSAVSPDEIYVRLAKFQRQLEDLEKDIQKAVKTEILGKNLKIEIGKYYLSPDPPGQAYSRVKILNAENSKALVYYVDYGDEGLVDISTLKTLPTQFLTRLPFQAIQCRLYGLSPTLGEWNNEATDVLYKYMLEPESDIYRPLFVEVKNEDEGDLVRSKVKYSILLKDGYGEKNVLINQLLLDCGYATSIFTNIEDFEFDRPVVEIEDDNEEIDDQDEMNDFDLVVHDSDELLQLFGLPNQRELQSYNQPQIMYSGDDLRRREIEAAVSATVSEENSSSLTPDVFWSQTDKTVRIKIKLADVGQYKAVLVQKRIFAFSTTLNERKYEVKFSLHKPVEMERHSAHGQEVVVILNKKDPVEWLQLTGTTKRLRYVHYEINDVEVEEPKRKFLQLDITDSESDGNDDDKPCVIDCSDIDSEFDRDIQSDSDEGDE